ncbi:hypothetical protein PENCOP_c010G08605 [Penicillium coprophilum]|uniref:tripeptidyl-peptidase II n=1 Tax=Penicillium coprophilum TaxID=36646 RepID=A0A1V6UGD9_9EURO|nr:hypothetical protein PENCOP_c010G08605 [Penicillium coprophilum]
MRLQSLALQILALVLSYMRLVFAADSIYQQVELLDKVPDAITQHNAGEFEQKVIELSTPGHASYGRHMKRDEVKKFLSPPPAISDRIIAWLRSENVPANSIDSDGHWISFTAPISQAEQMLKTNIAIRTLGYSVPKVLHPFIQLIQPTTRFGNLVSQRSSTLERKPATSEQLAAGCNTTITPNCLWNLYGLDDTTTRPEWRNRLGISGFLEQYARHADFEEFLRRYAQSHTNTNFSVVSINGGRDDQHSMSDSVEANLDVQYSIPLADEVLATFYSTGGRGPVVPELNHPDSTESTNEPYLEQLHYFLNLPDEELPAVLSNSYGEDEQTLLPSYVNATCSLFAQLAARGVSILFSSGDEGPGRTSSIPKEQFPSLGGGFSEVFPRPQYQDQAVKGYLKHLGSRWNGLYNATGRGYPDVSAQAASFIVRDHGEWVSVRGTSASAPVVAGIVSRLNSARLAQGKPRMGFLNPWLYSHGRMGFTDIVLGSSSGCKWTTGNADLRVPNASWDAVEGWDPATGLGTPLFRTLVRLLSDDV